VSWKRLSGCHHTADPPRIAPLARHGARFKDLKAELVEVSIKMCKRRSQSTDPTVNETIKSRNMAVEKRVGDQVFGSGLDFVSPRPGHRHLIGIDM
jgi:hypothetical protein